MRLGLAGGGSDVSPYSDIYGGLVLNATVNLYTYATIEETGGGLVEINSYDAGCRRSYPLSGKLDMDGEAALVKGVYNRIVRDYGPCPCGFRVTTYNDAPAGSGLGTSSTMVVCIIKAFAEWMSLPLGDYEIARMAYEVERVDLMLSGGKQDQYAAAFGGFNYMEFRTDGAVEVTPLKVSRWIRDELESSLLLYFTGRSRSSAAIIDRQKANTAVGGGRPVEAMHRIRESAREMKLALLKGDMREFARVLGRAWEDKKMMAEAVTNPVIERAFGTAARAGALAGKVSGAGGGGFCMFMADPTRKKAVADALGRLDGFVMPFQFTEGGARGWKVYDTDDVSAMSPGACRRRGDGE